MANAQPNTPAGQIAQAAPQILFKPDEVNFCKPPTGQQQSKDSSLGDSTSGRVYVYHHERIALAVNVALLAGRPLLVSGPSGSGKSTLALNVALQLRWRCYQTVITGRTEARDLLWRFDAVKRLADAQVPNRLQPEAAYREPGPIWWAFDPDSARRRGLSADNPDSKNVPDAVDPNVGHSNGTRAVLLIDEIDKADIDLPNNLLVPLGSWRFQTDTDRNFVDASANPPLVIITTNGERDLPAAFLRRCVTLFLPPLDEDRLVQIARAHLGDADGKEPPLYRSVAKRVVEQQKLAKQDDRLLPPSAAEYLDTLRACPAAGITSDATGARFELLASLTLRKPRTAEPLDDKTE